MKALDFYLPKQAVDSINAPVRLLKQSRILKPAIQEDSEDYHIPIYRFTGDLSRQADFLDLSEWLESEGLSYVLREGVQITHVFNPGNESCPTVHPINQAFQSSSKAA